MTKHKFLGKEVFLRAESGTIHKVFISKNYVLRLRTEDQEILGREVDLLNKVRAKLIPKVLAFGKVDNASYAIENKLVGKNINLVWKNLDDKQRKILSHQLINFIKYLKTQKKDSVYSVKTGKNYDNFYDLLTDGLSDKLKVINGFKETSNIVEELSSIVKGKKHLFIDSLTTLVHGDLVFHNLLTERGKLTGVLDWELALYGDPDYDIFRLMNFRNSAKLYLDQGNDEEFEFDYLDYLLRELEKSGLISNKKKFMQKYEVVKAVYYINALFWAAKSKNPKKYIKDTIVEWQKSFK